MKKIKNLFLLLVFSVFVFTSCENEETLVDDQQQEVTQESPTVTQTLAKMSDNFDDSGNVELSTSPAGNIIFDFCFDFVYPITLSYNTGATVVVNDFDDLINIMISSTDQLFVSGIAFPFDVETYDAATGSIVVQTINNETEFENLLLSCDFGTSTGCVCNEIYDPVCVEYTDPNGLVHIITYPNECEAMCDGFTQADFLTDCFDTSIYDFGFGCFDLNYPLDLILDDGSTITVNDDQEFANAMYNQIVVNFVYPISVTLEEDSSVVTVNNEIEFETVFNNCFGGGGTTGCVQCENEAIDPVCIEYTTASGEVVVEVFPNLCYAECVGYTAADVVDCNNGNPTSCDAVSAENLLTSCDSWNFVSSIGTTFIFSFNAGGNLMIFDDNFNFITDGTWSIMTDSNGVPYVEIIEANNDYNDSWYFLDCNPQNPIIVSDTDQNSFIISGCN